MYFPQEEYENRWERLDRELERLGYDVAVIWQRSGGGYDRAGNVWYLTNYASHASGQEFSTGAGSPVGLSFAAVLKRVGHTPELHIAEPAHTVERRYIADVDLHPHVHNLPLGLAERMKQLGIEGRVAYQGDDFLPAQFYRLILTASPQVEWVPEEYLLYQIQSHKSAREVDAFRAAGEISSSALTVLMEGLLRGERQCDAAADAASVVMRAGGGFQRIACHTGPESELAMWDYPLYSYSKTAPQDGDMIRGWVYGPIFEGYWIDPGRSSVCGRKPSSEQRKLVENTVDLIGQIIDTVRVGATPRESGIVGDKVVASMGYDKEMGGSLWDIYGHGLSTFFHGPHIPSHGAATFQDDQGWFNVDEPYFESQIMTVEAFIQEPGVGMASFEEIFVVNEGEPELLSTTPMLFW